MTGFARISGRISDGLGYTLSLKSVNHRFLDLHLRMPSGTDALEMRLRRILKQQILRGHVEVTLTLDRNNRAESKYDHALVASYIAAFRDAAEENGIVAEPDLNAVFRLPGVFSAEARSSNDEEVQKLEEVVAAEVEPLVAELNQMRAQEGRALVDELRAGLDPPSQFRRQRSRISPRRAKGVFRACKPEARDAGRRSFRSRPRTAGSRVAGGAQ